MRRCAGTRAAASETRATVDRYGETDYHPAADRLGRATPGPAAVKMSACATVPLPPPAACADVTTGGLVPACSILKIHARGPGNLAVAGLSLLTAGAILGVGAARGDLAVDHATPTRNSAIMSRVPEYERGWGRKPYSCGTVRTCDWASDPGQWYWPLLRACSHTVGRQPRQGLARRVEQGPERGRRTFLRVPGDITHERRPSGVR